MLRRRSPLLHWLFLIPFFSSFLLSHSQPHSSDGLALLAFKSKADLSNTLDSYFNQSVHYCEWHGVSCFKTRIVRLVLQSFDLGGIFASDTLTRLDQLRVLSLQNNSLTGPIPNLTLLINLKSLFLDHNSFSGSFPPSIQSLHRLRTIDLSHNQLMGSLPIWLAKLDRLYSLRLDHNGFNGMVPPFNQTSLHTLDISGNNLTGAVPVTITLLRFGANSFSSNPGLCGEILHRECRPGTPFFGVGESPLPTPSPSPPPPAQTRKQEQQQQHSKKHNKNIVIIGFSSGFLVLLSSILCFLMALRKQTKGKQSESGSGSRSRSTVMMVSDATVNAMKKIEEEMNEKVKKRVEGIQVVKSGNLVFCAGETQLYTVEQLMRGSAELLGRGIMGSTYKAVLDNRLIVCVKRLDAVRLVGVDKEMFERHMGSVGGLRHPNLVPLRAYFQVQEERLLVYDYQPNGSLFSLIHGSRSARAKPLHWTSCLKIAEDVAQGLSYIHQAWMLVHGNLKSSNVLLGADFEARVSDYCLSVLANVPPDGVDSNSKAYKAPETRNFQNPVTAKSDVYSFGVLLLELLTGRSPSQHPCFSPSDMMKWVISVREDNGVEESRMRMLLEVAMVCSLSSPEQRPTMWQVLKMLQEIKDVVLQEDGEMDSLHEMA